MYVARVLVKTEEHVMKWGTADFGVNVKRGTLDQHAKAGSSVTLNLTFTLSYNLVQCGQHRIYLVYIVILYA